jgi:hypothetical protein
MELKKNVGLNLCQNGRIKLGISVQSQFAALNIITVIGLDPQQN